MIEHVPTEYEMSASADVVQEISSAIARAIGEVLVRHGDDPNSDALIAAGVYIFVKAAEPLAPGLTQVLTTMLNQNGGDDGEGD